MTGGPWLVTGAAGFIGAEVVRLLLAEGEDVIGLVRPGASPGRLEPLRDHPRLSLLDVDLAQGKALRELPRRLPEPPARVLHLGAAGVSMQPVSLEILFETNVRAIERLAALDGGNLRFVAAGSVFEYGRGARTDGPTPEDSPLRPTSAYAWSKAAATLFLEARGAELGLSWTVLRPFGVYGPSEARHRLLPHVLDHLRQGKPVRLTPGSQIRDFSHVADIARAFISTARQDGPLSRCRVLNVGAGEGRTVRDIVLLLARAGGFDPGLLCFGAIPMRPDEVPFLVADIRGIQEAVGWHPEIPLEAGIRTLIEGEAHA